MIKAIELKSTFSFHESSLTEIQSEINALNTKKSNPANSVSILKNTLIYAVSFYMK